MNALKLAVGATLGAAALMSGVANALPPGDYDQNVLNVYFGGATATDGILENNFRLVTEGICAPGTIGIYRVQVSNRGNKVIFCRVTADQVAGFPASSGTNPETGGTKVAFHKESIGGSSNGVVPLYTQTTLEFFNMAFASSCTANPANPVGGTTDLNAYDEYTACPDNTESTVPNGGISDVEPALSFPAPSAAQLASLNSVVGLDIIFGVPVTEKLFRALQVAQGWIDDDTTPAITTKCTNAGGTTIDSPACMPSLSRSQIRGLYSQKLTEWSHLFASGAAGAENGVALTAVTGVTAPTNTATGGVADTKVYICRRVATSGTQATTEAYFFKQRCDAKNGTTASLSFAGGNPTVGTTPAAQGFNSRVTPGEGSGDVRSCLSAHNTNGTWAIGVLTTEASSAPSGWRMVKIDGAAPNIASVMNGQYDFFASNTLNRKATGAGVPTGLTLTLLQAIESQFGLKLTIQAANSSYQGRPWGDGGFLTRYSAANARVPDAIDGSTTTRDNPVNSQSKALVGNKVNNCLDPVSFGSTGKGTLITP